MIFSYKDAQIAPAANAVPVIGFKEGIFLPEPGTFRWHRFTADQPAGDLLLFCHCIAPLSSGADDRYSAAG